MCSNSAAKGLIHMEITFRIFTDLIIALLSFEDC